MDEFLRRLRYCFQRRKFEAELDEEMQHHLALAGRKQFGNVALLKEDSRTMWTWTFWEQLGQDFALRSAHHGPQPDLHPTGDALAGAGHRREHSHI